MFGIDVKDITNLIPFVINNLENCVFLIVASIIIGYFVGRTVTVIKKEKDISNEKEKYQDLQEQYKQIKDENEKLTLKSGLLGSAQLTKQELTGGSYLYLEEAGKIITDDSCTEINALIEIKIKNSQLTDGSEQTQDR